MSNPLLPHGLKHAKLPWPLLIPRVCSNSCPLSPWCHPTISSSVADFSCPQSFTASGSFPMSQLFTSNGQNTGASAISTYNEYSGLISFRMDWLDLLVIQGTLKSLLQHDSSKASILWCSGTFMVILSHPYITARKTIVLTIWTFSAKWCLCLLICCLGFDSFSSEKQNLLNSWL